MRKLMWFGIGFAAACAAGIFLFTGFWMIAASLFCALGGVTFCFVKANSGRRIAAALFGCAAAFAWVWCFQSFYLHDAKALDGEEADLRFTAGDYSYATTYGIAADGTVIINGKTYQMKAYIPEGEPLSPGDQIDATFRLRYTTFGGSQDPTYHQGKGIFLLGYCRQVKSVTTLSQTPPEYFPAWLRQQILDILDALFPEDTAAFAKALLLGDKTGLSYETDRNFQISGISHVIAVSGMHVTILFSLLYILCGKRRYLTALIGIPALLLFCAVAGFTPSIVRACVMQCLMILALLTNREYDPPTALAFAVIVLLAVNPMTVTDVGFQLSTACMAGIFLLNAPINRWLMDKKRLGMYKGKNWKARLGRTVAGTVSMTLSANVFTVPLCAIHFGMVSLVGIVTNLMVLWVISFIFCGIMLACILGTFWLPGGRVLAWVISWPIRYVLYVAGFLAKIPIAAVYTESVYITVWLVAVYVLLGIFLIWGRKYRKSAMGIAAMTLILAVLFSWAEPRLDKMRVTVLDVGQGQCVLLQSGNTHFLVDCGSEDVYAANKIANYLMSQGIFRLNGVILTHFDADHAGALLDLLTQVETDTLYLPDIQDSNGQRHRIEHAFPDKICWIGENVHLFAQDTCISFYPAENAANDNESSMCALFQWEKYDILITGDRSAAGERQLLEIAELPKLELLIAGHHGAADATCRELLLATRPKAVAISCGENNYYGHPAQSVLDRLQEFGCRIYRTDKQGTIIFRG